MLRLRCGAAHNPKNRGMKAAWRTDHGDGHERATATDIAP
jgi:hypothetical protein